MTKPSKIITTLFFLLIVWFVLFTMAFMLARSRRAHGAELNIGLHYLSGQHASRSLNLGLKLPIYEGGLFSSKIRYGKHDDEIVQNQGYLRLSYDPRINEVWSLWFYEQVGYDKPKEIDVESFTGGGPKYMLYESDISKASISWGYLYHYQELEDESKDINRLSLRLKGKTKVGTLDLFGIAFYQPNIEDFDDYLASGEIGLSMAIVQNLNLKLSIEDHYRSMLDEPNEFLTSLSLQITF